MVGTQRWRKRYLPKRRQTNTESDEYSSGGKHKTARHRRKWCKPQMVQRNVTNETKTEFSEKNSEQKHANVLGLFNPSTVVKMIGC